MIRKAGTEDRDTLVRLMREFYAETRTPFDIAEAGRAFKALLADDRLGRIWILEREGSPAGYGVLTVGFSMEHGGGNGFLDDLFVREEHRGFGLGRSAMDAVLAECRTRGLRALHLEVAPDNTAAMNLYRRFGFTDNARRLWTMRVGSGVTLRKVEEQDLPVFFEHQRDPESVRMAAFPSREREAFFAHWKKILADDGGVMRTVLLDGQVAGNMVSWEHEGIREIGYWIGREFWGRGVASRALAEFLKVVDTRPLVAHVVRHNLGSIRVLEKCGFVEIEAGEAAGSGPDGVVERVFRLD